MSTACFVELNSLDRDTDALESDLWEWWLEFAPDTAKSGDLSACIVVYESSVTTGDF